MTFLTARSLLQSRRLPAAVFLTALFVRAAYVLLLARDPFSLMNDAPVYVDIARQFQAGDYSGMFLDRFVTAPLYPFLLARMMDVTDRWLGAMLVLQVLLSSLSCVSMFHLAERWFRDREAAAAAAAFHALNPFMFYYAGTISTETLFMSFMLFSLHALEKALDTRRYAWTAAAAFLYGAAYLLKSPILLLSPFLALYIWQRLGSFPLAVRHTAAFAVLTFSVSLPYVLYHLRHGSGYILSSNGFETLVLWGQSEFGYTFARLDEPKERAAFQQLDWCGHDPEACAYLSLPLRERQKKYLDYALRWIRNNPGRYVHLKALHVWAFLRPGLVPGLHPRRLVVVSQLVWFPLYALALFAWLKAPAPYRNLPVFAFLNILLFTLLTYVQGRFRNLIFEPFVGAYAGAGAVTLLRARWSRTAPAPGGEG